MISQILEEFSIVTVTENELSESDIFKIYSLEYHTLSYEMKSE